MVKTKRNKSQYTRQPLRKRTSSRNRKTKSVKRRSNHTSSRKSHRGGGRQLEIDKTVELRRLCRELTEKYNQITRDGTGNIDLNQKKDTCKTASNSFMNLSNEDRTAVIHQELRNKGHQVRQVGGFYF